mmetsp:Transcript_5519/g.7170  ORF Transcript_5519/g.7170 Transcript_5519/m.7170 type:complete len:243 (-) Transcript_5519:73-801(-)
MAAQDSHFLDFCAFGSSALGQAQNSCRMATRSQSSNSDIIVYSLNSRSITLFVNEQEFVSWLERESSTTTQERISFLNEAGFVLTIENNQMIRLFHTFDIELGNLKKPSNIFECDRAPEPPKIYPIKVVTNLAIGKTFVFVNKQSLSDYCETYIRVKLSRGYSKVYVDCLLKGQRPIYQCFILPPPQVQQYHFYPPDVDLLTNIFMLPMGVTTISPEMFNAICSQLNPRYSVRRSPMTRTPT